MIQPFTLQPFSKPDPQAGLTISGQINRTGHLLQLRYLVHGPLQHLLLPSAAPCPERRHQLWQATCFEFFLAPAGDAGYWEANLSPAGHWNLYRFSAYRQAMHEEEAITSLPFTVARQPELLQLDVALDLAPLPLADQPLQAGISVVLQTTYSTTYWALHHPANRPDFHHRAAFCLALAAA